MKFKSLLAWRTHKKLTQAQAAHLLSVNRCTYHRWEIGKQKIFTNNLINVSRKTGVSIENLLT